MSAAYIGVTFFPPFFGLVSRFAGLWLLPLFLAAYAVLLFGSSERLRRVKARG
jgi:hypothetical protein